MRWDARFIHDEIWLRARRVLLRELRSIGLNSRSDEFARYLRRQEALGARLVDRLEAWLPGTCAALGDEAFLGAAHRRFSVRLPFILAFNAAYARWLRTLAPAPEDRGQAVDELSALFNLGIVLVDQISDEPELRGDVSCVFGSGTLEAVLREPAATRDLEQRIPTLETPELRVLGTLVAAFFRGAAALQPAVTESVWWEPFARALSRAHTGQSRAEANDETGLRDKSATPFLVPPLLILLARGEPAENGLVALGRHVGDVFWRVDDLVDVSRDFAAGAGNVALLRAGVRPGETDGRSLEPLLEQGVLESLAAEVGASARSALDMVAERTDPAAAATWIEMYVIDWLR